jgi:hypothetical protein
MIEVFKTNVQKARDAQKLVALLQTHFPCSKINFDLHDCDKIMRVEGNDFIPIRIMALLNENGFMCSVLE